MSNCPGVNSDTAGKEDGCKGCPNQSICSSQQLDQTSQEQETIEIANRLKNVKNIILVMSGKGGTGKYKNILYFHCLSLIKYLFILMRYQLYSNRQKVHCQVI